MTIPFEKTSKDRWDELVDILLLLPECINLSEETLKQETKNHESGKMEEKLRDAVLDLIYQLHSWLLRYNPMTDPIDDEAQQRSPDSSDDDAPHQRRGLYDVTTAFLAMYDAANVIAFSLLLLVSPPTDQLNHNHRIQFHAQSVLSADAFLDSLYAPAPGGGSLLMIFALKIVGLWGPLQQQRDYAIHKLQNWDRQGAAHGTRRFAAPVPLGCCSETNVSDVYHVNVVTQISRRWLMVDERGLSVNR